jgi:hypothetical protein
MKAALIELGTTSTVLKFLIALCEDLAGRG